LYFLGYVESWSEIIEIQEMGLETFEEKVQQVWKYEEDDKALDDYLKLDTSFYPSEFQREQYEMDNTLREAVLLLPHIELEHLN